MGREKLLNQLKKQGNKLFLVGIFVLIVGLFMTLIFLPDGFSMPMLIFLILVGVGIGLIVFGLDRKKGENSKFIKKYPKVLDLADSLDNVVYENDFIIISDKAIANKKNFCNIADLNEVLAIYEHIIRSNGIVTSHTVTLSLLDGRDMEINVFARKRETKDDLVLIISNYCPNARVGYTPENIEYVNAKRNELKNM